MNYVELHAPIVEFFFITNGIRKNKGAFSYFYRICGRRVSPLSLIWCTHHSIPFQPTTVAMLQPRADIFSEWFAGLTIRRLRHVSHDIISSVKHDSSESSRKMTINTCCTLIDMQRFTVIISYYPLKHNYVL